MRLFSLKNSGVAQTPYVIGPAKNLFIQIQVADLVYSTIAESRIGICQTIPM